VKRKRRGLIRQANLQSTTLIDTSQSLDRTAATASLSTRFIHTHSIL